MAEHGYLAGRPAKSHYACVANKEGQTSADVNEWLRSLCENVASDSKLSSLLKSGKIEALFWVALFGRAPFATPTLDADILNSIMHLNTSVLFENYTDLSEGCAAKTWYPTRPSPISG